MNGRKRLRQKLVERAAWLNPPSWAGQEGLRPGLCDRLERTQRLSFSTWHFFAIISLDLLLVPISYNFRQSARTFFSAALLYLARDQLRHRHIPIAAEIGTSRRSGWLKKLTSFQQCREISLMGVEAQVS